MRKPLFVTLLALCCMFANAQSTAKAPVPVGPLPTPSQVAWQQMETYAFIHFGLNTFNDREWGYGDSDLQTFNPTRLDCRQWARVVKKAGMKGIILTAKHHDGFCLWPTNLTEYCIRNTPYKEGCGDIVGELAEACREEGLKLGLYLSPWDRNQATYGTPDYVEYFYAQLTELLTRYGDLFEVWFDGANGGDGYYGGARETRRIDRRTYYNFPRAWEMVLKYQPQAVIFSDGGPGCRWVGNEDGYAFATNWSLLRAEEVYPGYPRYWELQQGHADGNKWIPAECNVSIRPGWFYHEQEDERVKTVEQLVDLYYRSVGHNGTFLVNFPVDKEGLIHPTDSARAVDFHRQVAQELHGNLLRQARKKVTNERGEVFNIDKTTDGQFDTYWATDDATTSATLTYRFDHLTKVNRMMLQEYIPLGQRLEQFAVDYQVGKEWFPLNVGEETTTVGYKRLLRFETIETKALRVRFLKSRGPLCISEVAAYYAPNAVPRPATAAQTLQGKDFTITEKTPVSVTLDLGKQQQIKGFHYQPESNDQRKGLVSHYEVWAGKELSDLQLVAQGEFSNIRNHPVLQSVYFTPIDARYVRLVAKQMLEPNEPLTYEYLLVE